MRKTLFITIYDGAIAKNVLRTDIFTILKNRFNLVLFVSEEKCEYYKRLYASDTVCVEVIPKATSPRFERMFNVLALSMLHTHTVRAKINFSFANSGGRLKYWLRVLAWYAGQFRLVHVIMRWIYTCAPDRSFDLFFARYSPGAVFVPNMISEEDFRLIKSARRHGVVSIGMPKSWDNLTSKTFFNIFPDWMMVQNALMKEEVIGLFGYPREKVEVVGFPQFDIYSTKSVIHTRQDFCAGLGIDPRHKIVLYAAAGHQLAPHDEEVLTQLIAHIDQDASFPKVHILVRPHPKYAFDSSRVPRRPFVSIDRPGTKVSGSLISWEFNDADIVHLANSLAHADVLVSTVSTLNIEGAIFDVPLISIGFDGNAALPPELSCIRYYTYDHMRPLVDSGGMTVARSAGELIEYVQQYLTNPSLHGLGRKNIIQKLVGQIGESGRRVAEHIIQKSS